MIKSCNIHAYQVGEHGDTEFAIWSSANVGCQPIMDLIPKDELLQIEDYARKEAYTIIEKKGATYYGIGSCMASITNCILNDEMRILPVSSYDEMSGTYFGYPAVVGRAGVVRRIGLDLSPEEQEKLNVSIAALKAAIKDVESE